MKQDWDSNMTRWLANNFVYRPGIWGVPSKMYRAQFWLADNVTNLYLRHITWYSEDFQIKMLMR